MLTNLDSKNSLLDSFHVCTELLPKVSRTFAISILHLKGPLKTAVITSYLLCRIADTIEDDSNAPLEKRTYLFDLLKDSLVDDAAIDVFTQSAGKILSGNQSHLELVNKTKDVFILHRSLNKPAKEAINRWVSEMAKGMSEFITRYPKGIHVQTIEEFRMYCYYVAGTVGHLLTDLWRIYSPRIIDDKTYHNLDQLSDAFGEGLQTVNILKDIATDINEENAVFIPEKKLKTYGSSHGDILNPAHLAHNKIVVSELIEMAKQDLDKALQYYFTLPRFAFTIKRFCILPLLFAIATLRELSNTDDMFKSGGQVKITRKEVKLLVIMSPLLICSNRMVRWFADRTFNKPLSTPRVLSSLSVN